MEKYPLHLMERVGDIHGKISSQFTGESQILIGVELNKIFFYLFDYLN